MPFAHKPVMYRDSDYNTLAYCSVCGQENLDTECPGEYVLKPSEQAAIDKRFSDDMNKIFLSKPNPHLSHYKKLSNRLKDT